jgi:hypothetical protein
MRRDEFTWRDHALALFACALALNGGFPGAQMPQRFRWTGYVFVGFIVVSYIVYYCLQLVILRCQRKLDELARGGSNGA